jgi:hypothetical protein
MRLGNAEDARVAAEHIGAEQRLLVAGVTDTAGGRVTGLEGDSYASTIAYARARGDALTDPVWSRPPDPVADDEVLVRSISGSTPWGRSVAGHARPDQGGATGPEPGVPSTPDAPEGGRQARELLVEQRQLQELPPTAMVFTHATANGRRTLLVDANPGIMTLPTAHRVEYEEYLRIQAALETAPDEDPGAAPVEERGVNLGPPPERLDFRRKKG